MSNAGKVALMLDALASQTSLPGIALGLERVEACLGRLGDPHLRLPPVIHIAGTNGKGSTHAYLKAMAEAAGLRVHAYTSPHLVRFHERIVLAGDHITDDQLLDALEEVMRKADGVPLTFFEATTLAAFVAFAKVPADLLLLEVGLGGRLDATNVVPQPLACVITPIAEDHKEFLGDTLAKIATEKAGIVKEGAITIVAKQEQDAQAVIEGHVRGEAYLYGRDWHVEGERLLVRGQHYNLPRPALAGAHQSMNAACAYVTALAVGHALPIDRFAIERGITKAIWPARLQRLVSGPLVPDKGELWLDGGHNPAAGEAVAAWVREDGRKAGIIAGMLARKDAIGFFRPFAGSDVPVATVHFEGEEAYSADALAAFAREAGCLNVRACSSLAEAADWLQQQGVVRYVVCGSLYLAGKILQNHA